ncbi:hypothetical protein J2Y58_000283 [Sphingomonas sp. BE138]|uniref:hypothetical protein n=1 Tax=Sphingomonas sp. BE138 TaxID=2817845 RepID=UPI0028573C6E|nr:hypothetical protein [Sphingomonas sp. BE138]MDR6786945.1 hypothetical protein [Sphingomonas sp. BE138]
MTVLEQGAGRRLATTWVPVAVMAGAGLAVRTPAVAAWPLAALLLFLWVVADTMMLALITRTAGKPERRAVLGVLAGASATVAIGAPPALRGVLWTMPWLMTAMVALVLAHVTPAARRGWRVPAGGGVAQRCAGVAAEVFPPALLRLARAELTVLHMALVRWGGAADVPAGARAFAYHRHLAPMCAALLILSGIEIAVCHLLLAHWSRAGAVVMFVLSDVGFVYLIGLIKSFRFRPILLTAEGVHVRAGFLIDRTIPLAAIAGVDGDVRGEEMRDHTTLNAALLAWPNVVLRLGTPLPARSWRRRPAIVRVAFRLDEPEAFVRMLRWRLERP